MLYPTRQLGGISAKSCIVGSRGVGQLGGLVPVL